MKKLIYLLIIVPILLTMGSYAQQKSVEKDTASWDYWQQKIASPNLNFIELVEEFDNFWEGKEIISHSGYKQFRRWESLMRGRVLADGTLQSSRDIINEYKEFIQKYPTDGALGTWTSLGPHNFPAPYNSGQLSGMGRIASLAFHPTDPDIIFAGAPAGGLWKTTDGGVSWINMNTDNLPTLGVSSIAIHPADPDIIYIGTGDRDSFHAAGLGVYKSTNGGQTWEESSDGMGDLEVNRLLMEPGSPNILLAATSKGIYKSIDDGGLWTRMDTLSRPVKDLVYKPGTSEILYAEIMGDIYRSDDFGHNWDKLSDNLERGSRGAIGVSPDDPERVYFFQTQDKKFKALYVSYDGGDHFDKKTADTLKHEGQGGYNLVMAVDPNNADIIYGGMVTVYKSYNAGDDWGQLVNAGEIHADQHVFEFSPHNGRLYVGNDGGVFSSGDGGQNWDILNDGMVIAQIYRMDAGSHNPNQLITGHQDGGTYVSYGNDFFHQNGGDGMNCLIDRNNNNIMYASVQHGNISRTLNGGVSGVDMFKGITHDSINGIPDAGDWITPYILDKINSDIMFLGYKDLWRSTNVTTEDPHDVTWQNITEGLTSGQEIMHIEQCPANREILYIVSKNNKLFKTINALGPTPVWYQLNKPLYGRETIQWIESHPEDIFTLYMSQGKRIWKSTDGGGNWDDISLDLPLVPINCIRFHEGTDEGLYIGTDVGVYYKDAKMTRWVLFKTGLPVSVRVRDLDIYYGESQDQLFAATYGRGAWKTDIEPNYYPNLLISSGACTVDDNQVDMIITAFNNQPETRSDPFSVGFYLSTNATISKKDYLIGEVELLSLQAGVYGSAELEINLADLPPEIEHGTYYAGAIIDYKHEVPETDEFDNEYTFPQQVEIHVPMQVQNVQASDGTGYWVNLTWEAPTDPLGPVYYRVFRNIANNPFNAEALGNGWQSYNVALDNTAEGGEDYYYWVKASYSDQGYRAGAFSHKDQGWSKLEPPADVEASQGTYQDRIKITWDPVPAGTHFKVYRSLINDLETAQALTTNWSSIQYYNDNTVLPGTDYYYWVKSALSSTGYRQSPGYSELTSGYRAWANAPDADASDGSYDDRIRVSWNSIEGATHYQVWKSTGNDPGSAYAKSEWITVQEYFDYNVTPGGDYMYWVKAANNPSGTNPTGFGDGDTGWVRFLPPTNLTATDGVFDEYVMISWIPTSGASYNKVYRSEYSGYWYAEEYSSWFQGNSFADTETDPGKSYYYWVRCTNEPLTDHMSDFSNEDAGWKKLAPSVVTATKGVYPWSVHVDFTPVEGAEEYRVSRVLASNPQNPYIIVDWTNDPPFHIEHGIEGQYTEFNFYVEAARDYTHERPSSAYDMGFAGECGNLADVLEFRESEIYGTNLIINHRVINNGAHPTQESGRIQYYIREYPGGDDYYQIGEEWVGPLQVGGFANISHSFDLLDIPENITLGEYTISYQLDVDGDVCENDEADNFIQWDEPFNFTNAMYGIYTVGGDDPDFEDLNVALDALDERGISDNVSLHLRPGVYWDPFVIPAIEGSSEEKRVTFTSDPNFSDTAQVSNSSINENFVFAFEGASYVTINGLKIRSYGITNYESTYARCLAFSNSHDIIIENNLIQGVNGPGNISPDNALVYANNGANHDILIRNNSLLYGSYGIYYIGSGTGDDADWDVEISGNQVLDFYSIGVYVNYVGNPIISSNIITGINSTEAFHIGIEMAYIQSGFRIDKNQIALQPSSHDMFGIRLKYCDNSLGERGLLANNFISLNAGEDFAVGIYLRQCAKTDVFYNSINVYGVEEEYSSCIELSCFDEGIQFNNNILNNIFSNTSGGLAIYYSEQCYENLYLDECDFNSFYVTGPQIAHFNGAEYSSLSQWQQLSGFDSNSIETDPEFADEINLHTYCPFLDGKATPVEFVVDDDIDGDARDMMMPDIGADEFDIPAADYDLSIYLHDMFFAPPMDLLSDEEYITVSLTNEGFYPMSNTSVSYQINGGDWITEMVSESIEPWNFYDYTFSQTADMSVPGYYEIIAKLSNPQDQNPLNDYDTLNIYVEPEPYCEWLYMMGCDWMYDLETVKLNTLNNEWSGCSDMGFGDYTYLSTDLEQGENYALTIQTGSDNMYVSVWIDFDNDHIFNDTDEKLVTDLYCEFGWFDYTANVEVPVSAYPGTHRMRVRSVYMQSGFNACDEYEYGEAEDYSVNITSGGGLAVNIGSGKSQSFCYGETATLSASVSGGTPPYTFLWSTGETSSSIGLTAVADTTVWVLVKDVVGYSALAELSYSVNQPPELMAWTNQPVCEGSSIELYADAWAYDSVQNYCTVGCDMPSYCSSGANMWGGPIVSEVIVGDINNNTFGICEEYSDFTNMKTEMALGEIVNMQVGLGYCDMMSEMSGKVYIDWNRDGDFEDSSEMVSELYTTWWEETYWIEMMVPVDAVLGTTKMRIVCREGMDTQTIQPCGNFDYGETEDYAIEIYELAENYIQSYSWTGPSGFVSSEQYPVITNADVSNKGHYNCLVTDGNGCTNDYSQYIFVSENAEAIAGPDMTICETGSVFLTGQVSHEDSFEWITGGDGTFDDPENLNTSYYPGDGDILAGEVELSLIAYPGMMCFESDTSSMVLTITTEPFALIDPMIICDDVLAVLLDGVYAENYTSLSWSTGGTGYFDDNTLLHPTYFFGPDDSGEIDFVLELQGLGSCPEVEVEGQVLIQSSAEVDAGSDLTICEFENATLEGFAENHMNLTWSSNGDGMFDDPMSPVTTYQPGSEDISNGLVILTLEAASFWPCTLFEMDEMQLTILPDLAEMNAGSDVTVCTNQHQLNAISSAYAFVYWTTAGDGTFDDAGILNPVYTAGSDDLTSGAVVLTVEMMAAYPCNGFALDEISLEFIEGPAVNAGSDAGICEVNTWQLIATASNFAVTEWQTSGDGIFDNPFVLDAVYTPGLQDIEDGGTMLTIEATAISPCAGSVTDQMGLIIQKAPLVSAGADGSICETEDFVVEGTANFYSAIQWSGYGDGMFDNPMSLITSYTPGNSDILSGIVTLILTSEPINPCVVSANDHITLQIMKCHELVLSPGWSGISSWVDPVDAGIEDMFAPVVNDLIILLNLNGMYWPSQSANTLGNWSNTSGYAVKMTNAGTLNLVGANFAESMLETTAGWNLIPVLSKCPVDVVALMEGSSLVIMKEAVGFNMYWPQFGINTIGEMQPGSSYFALMDTPGEVIFPACYELKTVVTSSVRFSDRSAVDVSPWEFPDANAITHIIGFPADVFDNVPFGPGDFMGAFGENGQCYGVRAWANENISLVLTGDDLHTQERDGFIPGEPIAFQLYSLSDGVAYDLEVEYDRAYPDHTGKFNIHGLSVVKQLEVNTNGVWEEHSGVQPEIFPNPTRNRLHVRFDEYNGCRMELFDVKANLLKTFILTDFETVVDISGIPVGVITVKISGGFGSWIEKVIKY
nr:hypothetical protein [Bacteroidota bacterium]